MAYVEPNSTIQIFKNVPLDNSYKNSYWFTSINAQDDFFGVTQYNNFYGITFPENSYTRKGRGFVRLNIQPDTIIAYNYMRYRNVNHARKWYYAFITDVEYINENTAEITFELDYIQTYMFDVVIKDSFVERQHNLTDNIGDNLVTESLPIGSDYFVENHDRIINLKPDKILFIVSKCVEFRGINVALWQHNPPWSVVNGYPSKVAYCCCDIPTTEADSQLLANRLSVAFSSIPDDSIVAMFPYNSILDSVVHTAAVPPIEVASFLSGNFYYEPASNLDTTPRTIYSEHSVTVHINGTGSTVTAPISLTNKFGEYTVKNNKLLTYPYKYLEVETGEGSSQELKYELFYDQPFKFDLIGSLTPKPMYALYPVNYADSVDVSTHTNPYPVGYDFGLELSVDSSIPFSTDTYKGYLLSNSGTIGVNLGSALWSIVSSFGGGISSIANVTQNRDAAGKFTSGFNTSGIPVAGATKKEAKINVGYNELNKIGSGSAMQDIKAIIAEDNNARHLANGFKGNFDNSGVLVGNDRYGFEFNQLRIKEENARIIDSFFTMYGYAQKQLMPVLSPSSDSLATKNARRPHFNYTKTIGCNVFVTANSSTNGCPAGDIASIAEIYDNGITFWNPADTVGDYNYNNSPTVTP